MMAESKLATILYLDDSEAQLADVSLALTRLGYPVNTATTLTEALRKLKGADLVMVDFHMPGLDGAKAMQQLRGAVARDATVAFYLYTSDREVATSYRSLGFDGAFVEKGDTSALLQQIHSANRMLQLKRLRNERQKP